MLAKWLPLCGGLNVLKPCQVYNVYEGDAHHKEKLLEVKHTDKSLTCIKFYGQVNCWLKPLNASLLIGGGRRSENYLLEQDLMKIFVGADCYILQHSYMKLIKPPV